MFTLDSWIFLSFFSFLPLSLRHRTSAEHRSSVDPSDAVRSGSGQLTPPTFRACRAGTMRRRTGREDERSGIRPADVDSRGSAAPLGRLSLLIASYSVQPAHSANLTHAFFTSVASALTLSRSLHSKPVNPLPSLLLL